jgi:predicted nucleic acid-binding protein
LNLVVDSYAWIELFLGTAKGERTRRLISEAEEIRTPDIVLAEISRKYHREQLDTRTVRARLETISSTTIVTEIDINLALRTGTTYRELAEKAKRERLDTPGLLDAIILATAREYDSSVVTGDDHFRGLPETIFLN